MTTAQKPTWRHSRALRRATVVLAAVLFAALLAFAISRLDIPRIGQALITATPGWILLALALMAGSLLLRATSWHQVLRAALPEAPIGWPSVARATMIGVMGSALFPGRIGEPSRVLVLARRLDGPTKRLLPVVAGTVFSQTLINLLALGILAAVTFTTTPLFQGHLAGLFTALALPLAICVLIILGPRLLRLGERSSSQRVQRATIATARMLYLAKRGLVVFVRPRNGLASVTAQLLAWTLQWLACYAVGRSLGLQAEVGLGPAAAVLLAVNLSAILPATPSNIGVFQAACLVVLAAYGVGAGKALAYGIILQAVELLTALALGIPALLGEGLSWNDLRRGEGLQAESSPVARDPSAEESSH